MSNSNVPTRICKCHIPAGLGRQDGVPAGIRYRYAWPGSVLSTGHEGSCNTNTGPHQCLALKHGELISCHWDRIQADHLYCNGRPCLCDLASALRQRPHLTTSKSQLQVTSRKERMLCKTNVCIALSMDTASGSTLLMTRACWNASRPGGH